jgi:hypothetical protein
MSVRIKHRATVIEFDSIEDVPVVAALMGSLDIPINQLSKMTESPLKYAKPPRRNIPETFAERVGPSLLAEVNGTVGGTNDVEPVPYYNGGRGKQGETSGLIADALKEHGSMTATELAKACRLSYPTVVKCLKEGNSGFQRVRIRQRDGETKWIWNTPDGHRMEEFAKTGNAAVSESSEAS